MSLSNLLDVWIYQTERDRRERERAENAIGGTKNFGVCASIFSKDALVHDDNMFVPVCYKTDYSLSILFLFLVWLISETTIEGAEMESLCFVFPCITQIHLGLHGVLPVSRLGGKLLVRPIQRKSRFSTLISRK